MSDNTSSIKISDGRTLYSIGDIVDLMLEIDISVAAIIGPTINVQVSDRFGNLISAITADNIGGGLYATEYTIPRNLASLYNIGGLSDENPDVYDLTDAWFFPDGSVAGFDFAVSKRLPEQPVTGNCIYEVSISGVSGTDGSVLSGTKFRFTSELSPYYCSVTDVVDVHSEYLSTLDHMQIVDQIVDFSQTLDMNLKPDHIIYQDRYDNAAKYWVAYTVAYNLLSSGPLDVTAESKDLNGFKIYKQYDRNINSGIHRNIQEYIDYFELIVLAGGKDTPFTAKTFTKGIYDPRRPKTNRSNLDISDFYPWVNESTSNTVFTNQDGSTTEVQGTRTIGYRWRLGYYSGNYTSNGTDLNSHAVFPSIGSLAEQQETMY